MIGISQPTNFILSKSRFQRNYQWDVLLPDIGFTLGGFVGLAIGQYIQEVSFGDYSMESPVTMKYGPYQASFAGTLRAKDITMTFLKPAPDIVSMYFNAWKKLIIDDLGLYSAKSRYQKTIYIRFLDTTGVSLGQYKLIGCFPTTFPEYSLNYENEVSKIRISFRADKIEYSNF